MRPKLRAWVTFDGGTKFGEGRAELLRLVDSEGSLKRAVERMGMSYRAAWGYVRELEAAAGFAFLERSGTGPSGGARLTARGRAFVAAFGSFKARIDDDADRAFAAEFGGIAPPPRSRRRKRSRANEETA
jgi:molybdate transport system regulatory protein